MEKEKELTEERKNGFLALLSRKSTSRMQKKQSKEVLTTKQSVMKQLLLQEK